MNDTHTLQRGDAPLLISVPHLGTFIPPELRPLYSDVALTVADTDWHLDLLYDFACEMGATILGARVSRYVIDLNRPPNDESLYPGQTTTSLCPTETFNGEPIYRNDCAPDDREKQRRVAVYWQPYHDVLALELARLRARHPHVLLWEAHSIASWLPRLFSGKLPDLNVGTQDGKTVAREIEAAVVDAAARSSYTLAENGRFKGGYITRHFGDPQSGIHAIQLEICQSIYMRERAPFEYLPERAADAKNTLRAMLVDGLRETSKLPALRPGDPTAG